LRGFRDLISRPQTIAEARTSATSQGSLVMRLAFLVLVTFGAAGSAGCGPAGYLQQVQGRARQAVAEARQAGAERAAPYEYTAAVEYLKKAQEEGEHAEYRVAIELGRRSEDFAKRATALARQPGPAAAGGAPAGREDRRGEPPRDAPQRGEN